LRRRGWPYWQVVLVIYALDDSLFTLLIMCHMCCGAFAFLMVSCQRTKTIKSDFGALFTFRIS